MIERALRNALFAAFAAFAASGAACGGKIDLSADLDAAADVGPSPMGDGGFDADPNVGRDATTDSSIDAHDASADTRAVDTGRVDDGGTVIPNGGEISAAPFSTFEAETHTIVGPNQYVVVAWIAIPMGGASHIGYRFSSDFGATWHGVAKIDSPGGREASDPVVAVDAAGNFYMTWIGYHLSGMSATDMQTYVAKAPVGATSFDAPVVVNDPNENQPDQYDKPWITVTAAQNILVTWTRFDSGGNASSILMARSTDGQSWTRSTVTTGGSAFRNLAMPCTAGARVWVTYQGDEGALVRWSDDQGATWSATNESVLAGPNAGVTFDDTSCVAASATEVWVEYELSVGGATAASQIMVAHSVNGGATFAAPTNAATTTALGYHAQLAIESTGALDLVYYGGASDPDSQGSYRRTRSIDRGVSFSQSMPIKSMTFLTDRQSTSWIGDYVGVAWSGGHLFTSFTDNSGGTSHISFSKITLP